VYKISPSDWSVSFAAQSGAHPSSMSSGGFLYAPTYLGENCFAITQMDQTDYIRKWKTSVNDLIGTIDLSQSSSRSGVEVRSVAMIPTQPGMFMILEKGDKLWDVTPILTSINPTLVDNGNTYPQAKRDHNMNLNNTTAVFRWCHQEGFSEWGLATGRRSIPVRLGKVRFHCWYLSRGGLGRAVVLTNDYLMVIDATYGLNNGGALKI
jgi:hypothetical protein